MLRNFIRAVAAHWRVGLIALASALVWVVHFDRWTLASWRTPTDYYIDAHETLARLKAASEGDIWPLRSQVIERLGAPFGAHWNGYPTPDKPLMIMLGAFVHAIGLYAAANVGFMLAAVSAAIAFYIAARWLRCRWEWAAAGALLFAFTYHTFHRGLSLYSLVFTWTVPLGLLAVWLVAGSRRIEWRRPGAFDLARRRDDPKSHRAPAVAGPVAVDRLDPGLCLGRLAHERARAVRGVFNCFARQTGLLFSSPHSCCFSWWCGCRDCPCGGRAG